MTVRRVHYSSGISFDSYQRWYNGVFVVFFISHFLAALLAAGFKVPYLGTRRVFTEIPCDALISEAKSSSFGIRG